MNDNFRDFTEGQDDDNYMQEQEGEEQEREGIKAEFEHWLVARQTPTTTTSSTRASCRLRRGSSRRQTKQDLARPDGV